VQLAIREIADLSEHSHDLLQQFLPTEFICLLFIEVDSEELQIVYKLQDFLFAGRLDNIGHAFPQHLQILNHLLLIGAVEFQHLLDAR
jgi:hypothetical protein